MKMEIKKIIIDLTEDKFIPVLCMVQVLILKFNSFNLTFQP